MNFLLELKRTPTNTEVGSRKTHRKTCASKSMGRSDTPCSRELNLNLKTQEAQRYGLWLLLSRESSKKLNGHTGCSSSLSTQKELERRLPQKKVGGGGGGVEEASREGWQQQALYLLWRIKGRVEKQRQNKRGSWAKPNRKWRTWIGHGHGKWETCRALEWCVQLTMGEMDSRGIVEQ